VEREGIGVEAQAKEELNKRRKKGWKMLVCDKLVRLQEHEMPI